MFHTFLFCLFMWRPMGVFGDEVKSLSVKEGDSVTLYTDITDIDGVDLIMWMFGPQELSLARINKEAKQISIYYDVLDGRFRDRLVLIDQTGDLTITKITTQHSGLYKVNIRGKPNISYRFNVTVYGDEVKSVSVKKGESVTLHTHITEIQTDQEILWTFGPKEAFIARINTGSSMIIISSDVLGERFRGRVQLNKQTGDLTITNITTQHTGLYKMTIIGKQRISYKFSVTLCVSAGVFGDEVKSVSVKEGDSVTLYSNVTELQRDDLIEWMFGPQETRIARIYKAANTVSIYDDVLDGRFRDRLQLNDQTGDLTITNLTTQHTGLYQINIRGKPKTSHTFNVTVCDSAKL